MKNMKKWLSAALAALLALGLTACGTSDSGSSSVTSSKESSAVSESQVSTDAGSEPESQTEESFEPANLVVSYVLFGPEPADLKMIEDEVNKLTQEELNVTVELKPHSTAAYRDQINLQLISGEQIDVFITGNLALFDLYSNQVTNGQLLELDGYLDQYGQGIKDVMGDYVRSGEMDGKVYGIPQNRDLAVARSFVYDADVADRNGIKPEDITSFEELEEAFATIKENEPDLNVLHPGDVPSSTNAGIYTADGLDNNFGILEDVFSGDATVVNLFDTKTFRDTAKMAKRWADAGYLIPEADTTDTSPYDMLSANRIFGFLSSYKPGIESQTSIRAGGKRVYASVLSESWTYSAKVTNFMWSINASTADPVQATRFMNLMYTSPEYMNLMAWGIEGTHYERVDGTEHTIRQLDASSNYAPGTSWIFGNEMLCYVSETDDDNMREELDAFNKSATRSPATGFTFNPESVATEVAACQVIWDEVNRSIGCGLVDDIDAACDAATERLMNAGLQKIIDEKQAQLDAFLAE